MGLPVSRIEMSRRFFYGELRLDGEAERSEILAEYLDPLTQVVYERQLDSFGGSVAPVLVQSIPITELRAINKSLGLGMDEWDLDYYTELFHELGRDPTDVELMQLGNANSEHSRHWYFRGIQVIDGMEKPETLMDIVRRPLEAKRGHTISLTAFHDNAGVMRGHSSVQFMPRRPGFPSSFAQRNMLVHITSTAETHNHPTYVAPFPGAETGAGGRIRDSRAVGRGGMVHAGFAGYAVGNLLHEIAVAGEVSYLENAPNASPLDVLIQGSNGVSDYGNKIGEPLIGGFCRSFGQLVDGAWREFRKPILYSAGLGRVMHIHYRKAEPKKGMLIVRIGGPAYRIGVGGGSASSMIQGSQDAALDLKSVQRGNAEMEQRVVRVIQACCELRSKNPILSIHDQGAGGPSNVLTELMEPLGGEVDIRKITVGDPTMSVLELWVAEFQEGFGMLIHPRSIEVFRTLCARERVHCEVLGEVNGSGNVVVRDSRDDSTPVNLPMKAILGKLPQKRFVSETAQPNLADVLVPAGVDIFKLLIKVFSLPSVGSKGFLVRKVDRSVTGLVARQQCCGPSQVPVANAAVTADGFFGFTGAASAFGEQPIKMLISPEKGARMAVVEMLTNMASVQISDIDDIVCRANWMYAAKRPNEGAHMHAAAVAMSEAMCELGIVIDGGKDSLSMAAIAGRHTVVAPGQLVIMGSAPVPDVRRVVTPDLKGGGVIGYIHLGSPQGTERRLGGSALAQALGQLGRECPDVSSMEYVKCAFEAVQHAIRRGLLTAYHDVSDGGFITAAAEMVIAGNRGMRIYLPRDSDPITELFHEEAGMLIEYDVRSAEKLRKLFKRFGVRMRRIGVSPENSNTLQICRNKKEIFSVRADALRGVWEDTSSRLEKLQVAPAAAQSEQTEHRFGTVHTGYRVPFRTRKYATGQSGARPCVAIVREEGTNGDREMAAAFYAARMDPYDISMSDLVEGRITSLAQFRGLVFPGGFSYADVFGSAKGWAGPIRFNDALKNVFTDFYRRDDTFSLGVCNGCQLMSQIGWLPMRQLPDGSQPRFVHNDSGRFESRWAMVEIRESPAVMLRGMAGSKLGIWIAHGEGKMIFPDDSIREFVRENKLAPIVYSSPDESGTTRYPYNPNGSPEGWTALCSPDGRHLAMMPHPERSFLSWQWPWWPKRSAPMTVSPWLKFFQNARTWCDENPS